MAGIASRDSPAPATSGSGAHVKCFRRVAPLFSLLVAVSTGALRPGCHGSPLTKFTPSQHHLSSSIQIRRHSRDQMAQRIVPDGPRTLHR
eukprot:5402423-Pyramimonas_sp.AAC.1